MKDLFSVKDRNILVTGGAQGIGRTVAQSLLAAGAQVGLVDINGEKAAQTATEIAAVTGGNCASFACDVTDPQAVAATVDAFVERFGTLDAVFNNAGITYFKAAETLTPDEWQRVIDVNLNGVFYIAQAAARQFIRENKAGSIVNTASMSGLIVNIPQQQSSYNTSKSAVIHLTKSLAVEWAPHKIRVNCISPGYIRTDMTGSVRQDWVAYWEDLIPFKRMGTPEELVGAVIYLMSDASTYTSGANLVIDGCFTCI
ncbi:MAG: SDR family oxidoreductase [Bacillota bacterium]|nr:SDR family oxidoreductase [Bacillota bacterium]